MRSLLLRCVSLVMVACATVACSGSYNNGCSGGLGGSPTGIWGGDSFNTDPNWKTTIPNQLKDSSSTVTVQVVMQFASAFTASDSTEVTSTGGTVRATNVPPSRSFIMADYPLDKLLALAASYTGTRIVGVSWNYFGGGPGCSM